MAERSRDHAGADRHPKAEPTTPCQKPSPPQVGCRNSKAVPSDSHKGSSGDHRRASGSDRSWCVVGPRCVSANGRQKAFFDIGLGLVPGHEATPAGWYDDPQLPGENRWWDGERWWPGRSSWPTEAELSCPLCKTRAALAPGASEIACRNCASTFIFRVCGACRCPVMVATRVVRK